MKQESTVFKMLNCPLFARYRPIVANVRNLQKCSTLMTNKKVIYLYYNSCIKFYYGVYLLCQINLYPGSVVNVSLSISSSCDKLKVFFCLRNCTNRHIYVALGSKRIYYTYPSQSSR